MKQEQMRLLVPRKLKEVEAEYGIRILYAVESGSRAWGTCSEESDFDVRFIYVRPKEDYLRLVKLRDVLEFPIEDGWDMCGWDISKLLQLLHSANSQIYEWFGTSLVYLDEDFSRQIQPLLELYFSVKTGAMHYLHQAKGKMARIAREDPARVKDYLYTLQYLASVRWILERKMPVPVSFSALMELHPEPIRQQAEELLARKYDHQRLICHQPELEAWQDAEFSRLQALTKALGPVEEKSWEPLEQFFLRWL